MKQKHLEVALFLTLILGFYFFKVSYEPLNETVKFIDHITEAAETYDLEPALVAAIIHAESDFNPNAHSHAGAKGLMQITGVTQRYLKLKNVFDPKENIFAGAKYIKELLVRFDGRLHLVIAAYNAGPGAVHRFGGVPPYRETRAYVTKVMKFMKEYQSVFEPSTELLFPGQFL